MIKRIFSVYDEKADIYSQPFFCVNCAVATRSYATASNDPSTEFSRFPTDFTLYEIGEFNDTTGEITCHLKFVNLGKASSFINPEVIQEGA
jgi:hypothetical protein